MYFRQFPRRISPVAFAWGTPASDLLNVEFFDPVPGAVIAPADAAHGHTAGSSGLSFTPRIAPANALHDHAAESPSVTFSGAGSSAPQRVATTAAASSNAAISVDFTGLVAAGDLLLIHRLTNAQEANGTVPPAGGWAQVSASPQSIGTSGAVGATALNLYWKLSDGTETTVDLGDSGAFNRAIGIVYRGVHQTTPIHAAAGNTQDGSSSTASMPSVTTTTAECVILHAVALGRDATGASWDAWTNAALTGLAEFHDAGTSTGNGGNMALADGVLSAAGSTGTTTATKSALNSAHITIAIAPPAGVSSITGDLDGSFGVTLEAAGSVTATGALDGAVGFSLSASAGVPTITGSGGGDMLFLGSSQAGAALITGFGGGVMLFSGIVQAGAPAVRGSGGGNLLFSGSSLAGTPMVTGAGGGNLLFGGSAAGGRVVIQGVGGGNLFFAGSAAATVVWLPTIGASLTASFSVSGSSAGSVYVQGSASGVVGFTLSSDATVDVPLTILADAVGMILFAGSSTAGALPVTGQGGGDLLFGGASTATLVPPGVNAALVDGYVIFTATIEASALVRGDVDAVFAIVGSSEAAAVSSIIGDAAGMFLLSGFAQGETLGPQAPATGDAAGTVQFALDAYGQVTAAGYVVGAVGFGLNATGYQIDPGAAPVEVPVGRVLLVPRTSRTASARPARRVYFVPVGFGRRVV